MLRLQLFRVKGNEARFLGFFRKLRLHSHQGYVGAGIGFEFCLDFAAHFFKAALARGDDVFEQYDARAVP